MEIKLLQENDPFLKLPVDTYTGDFLELESLATSMIKIMREYDALGLSANQVGYNVNMFVMRQTGFTNDDIMVCINPEVISYEYDSIVEDYEGCLSFPSLYLKVDRPSRIKVSYHSISYASGTNFHEKHLYGMDARCFLHECDHLKGITFDTKVSFLKLSLAKKKRDKLLRLKRKNSNNKLY